MNKFFDEGKDVHQELCDFAITTLSGSCTSGEVLKNFKKVTPRLHSFLAKYQTMTKQISSTMSNSLISNSMNKLMKTFESLESDITESLTKGEDLDAPISDSFRKVLNDLKSDKTIEITQSDSIQSSEEQIADAPSVPIDASAGKPAKKPVNHSLAKKMRKGTTSNSDRIMAKFNSPDILGVPKPSNEKTLEPLDDEESKQFNEILIQCETLNEKMKNNLKGIQALNADLQRFLDDFKVSIE